MGFTVYTLVIICFLASGVTSNCVMEGVTIWQLPITVGIEDYYEGVILNRAIQNIQNFNVAYYDDLNGGPYVSISIANSRFVISTNEAYKQYEENEMAHLLNFAVTFNCADGTNSLPLNIQIPINDNNNNDPLWKTEGSAASLETTYDFTIATPVAPGFPITDCVRDIIVRDVDLTNYAIEFGIEDNPYFEISYDASSSTVDKEYKASLRTNTFIRSIPEPIVLRISATDMDETQDPPITTYTTVTIRGSTEFVLPDEPVFSQPIYVANYNENDQVTLEQTISLQQGYDSQVQFSLEGDYAEDHFDLVVGTNQVSLTVTNPLPSASFRQGQIHLVVKATREYTSGASSTIVLQLPEAQNLEFERAHYEGEIVDNTLQLTQLILSEGYQESTLTVTVEDYPSFFTATTAGNIITLSMTPLDDNIIEENNFINLRVTASSDYSSATTIVTLEIIKDDIETPLFGMPLYTGTYDSITGLTLAPLLLTQGYDETVQVTFSGEHENYFELVRNGPSSVLQVIGGGLPSNILNEQHILFSVEATKPRTVGARTVVSIALPEESESELESFEKLLYVGTINLNVVQHETITVTGYTGNTVEILGDYRHLFVASINEGSVVVVASGTLTLPEDVTHVPMKLQAGAASAVLLLDVNQSETPELPTVIFGSPSYVMRANMAQTGLIGRVSATASNGESVAYTLIINNAHLQERISITGEGEIHLSASTNTGVYSFEVFATSIITQVQATAAVQLTVEVAATCGDDDHHLPPLIILNGDEEEPHENLVVLDSATQAGCTFRLTNSWPPEHDWLYVDANGLHARVIDREDSRIAFMALSQIQVEIVLECPSDTQTRVKRSLNTNSRHEWLGPYDYGNNRWILTDTILYNSRRSFVNFIVNDINDNYPIFIGYDNEPVVVGYPIPELEDVVLPRALAELKATDADVGENAQLVYWSSEPVLAVAPSTGSVHVRDGATLTDEEVLTVSVTDLNGREEGLTTSMQIMVKLIDVRHIAVVTVRNAFLDHEDIILSNLTAAVGYEVKALSSAVISDDTDTSSANARNKPEVTSAGASLQLYVYGLIEREPVAVEQLSTDISENVAAIDVTSTISLEDHLEGREIPVNSGRDTGLLVATIVLSVLLFILIVAIAVWFFLRWRKARNYEQFSDVNSVASRNEPLEEPPKMESLKKPRLNLEELKRSERRLQEMLEAPVEDTAVKPSTSAMDPTDTFDTIINMAPPDTPLPIVIQSIDRLKDNATSEDEDEFGERTKKGRRKSVVTFNENVEKIIHVEDIPDDNSSEVEVFKF